VSPGNQPLFSVVIPTFERAGLIGDALDSILSQDIPDIQVVVVDDGSTDDTRPVVERFGASVEYVYQDHAGAARARNNGLRRCRGEFIGCLDSDDVWLPGKLAAELDIFRTMPAAEVIISDSEHWHEDRLALPSRFVKTGVSTQSGNPEFLPAFPPLWVRRSLVSTCCLTFRKTALDRLGPIPFDVSLDGNEDWDFEIRLYHSSKVVVCPRILAKVRRYYDQTRGQRGMPNQPRTLEQQSLRVSRERKILSKSLGLPGLSPEIAERIHARLQDVAAEMNQLTFRRADLVEEVAAWDWIEPAEERFLAQVEEQVRGREILDIGVGGGRTVCRLLRISSRYVGIDYSPEMVAVCERKFPGARFLCRDARDLTSFDNDSFGLVVFTFNGIDYVSHEDRRRVMREVARVLEPGGYFLFSSHNIQSPLYSGEPRAYAVVPEDTKNYSYFCYYAGKREVLRQIAEAGFSAPVSVCGRDGSDAADASASPWLHYLARK
jgi:glycosyltransferase involved in cell wall biosynthesis